jgi:dissimilatory sulfite reductase related protein
MTGKEEKTQNISYEGIDFQVDNEGFLINPDNWNEFVACALARKEGIKEIASETIEILVFIREYYKSTQAFPSLTFVAKSLHKSKSSVLKLFGSHATAWKIAGLPQPKDELSFLLGGL